MRPISAPWRACALDFTQLLREWEQTSRGAELGSLRELATTIWRPRADAAQMAAQLASRGELTHAQERAALTAGLARTQESHAAWHRADLIHGISQHLPDQAVGRDQEHAWQILQDLTSRALAGQAGEDVLRLDAREWPRVPDSLRRANGESIYRAHGSELYATRSQLSLEQQLLAQAQEEAAPHLPHELAAQLLGADATQLDAILRAQTPPPDGTTAAGLRLDQATAAFLALTSRRRAELIVGPAGTGKTFTAMRIAAAWRAAGMGRVYGIAATSAGRNILTEAGIQTAENTAQFLGHLPGHREARGATSIGPGALLILDEASMTSLADLAAVIRHAARMGAKVVITGDHAQLTAIEAGGAMAMLARKLGYAQLTEATRFAQDWERGASMALRAGYVPVLGLYDEQGRLHGGSYEEMAERACRAYLTEYLTGTDVILTACTRRECADLARRVQGYLLEWGQLEPGPTTALREDARAYTGDLIIARQNDNQLQAGAPGRTLANSDLLRIETIGEDALTVRRLTGHDKNTRERTWSAPFSLCRAYAAENCDLSYALTWQTVQGRTVSVAIAMSSDQSTRAGLYVAMTRGRDRNEVYAYPAVQDPAQSIIGQGPAPDPEIARQRRLQADRDGTGPTSAIGERDPIALLAPVVRRGPADLSATETREQALSNADHLGALYAIWQDQCHTEATRRYARAVRELAEPADAEQILKDTDALWRTIRSAELAGLHGADVIRAAIAGRPFTGARSHAAVLDARIRKQTAGLPPKERESWTASRPVFADQELARYMGQVAAAMDDRQQRIGEHAARERPLWATQALGDVPAEPTARVEWERRAARLGAYREITGYDHPGQAIGPEPAATSPEARAEWHTAFAVMAHIDGIDVRNLTDGQLLTRRRAYEAETSWAPVYVAEELRAARRQEQFSRIEAIRRSQDSAAAARRNDTEMASLHQKAADSWTALGQRATLVREQLAEADDTRRQWEAITEPTRPRVLIHTRAAELVRSVRQADAGDVWSVAAWEQ
jgi:AAA domain